MDISFTELAQFLGISPPSGNLEGKIATVSTDTRTFQPGDCFVALRGVSFDGHNFVSQAVAGGAAALVVEQYFPEFSHVPQFVVPNTLWALGEIARLWRNKLAQIPLVAVVGSNGKTTVKEMTANILAKRYQTLSTQGNLNNLVGVPLTLFRLEPMHEAAVLELGMNQAGELERLVQITSPNVLVLTNITNAHVGMFGSLEGLYAAKTESLRAAPPECKFVLNAEDELSQRAMAEFAGNHPIVRFGVCPEADVRAECIEPLVPFGYRFVLLLPSGERANVELRMFGRHNVANALAAAAVGALCGVTPHNTAEALASFRPASNRSEVEELNGWYLVKDYYNASPAAVEQALRSLAEFSIPGRRYAVLGDMMELGDLEEYYHTRVGETAAQSGLDRLFTIGTRARTIHAAASRHGLQSEHFDEIDDLAKALTMQLRVGDLLLIKASRLMKLERLYDLLKGTKST